MPSLPRITVPEFPYHVIQRGNRKQVVFFKPEDKDNYLEILYLNCKLFKLEIWAYCLMDNHVHLIACPKTEKSLTLAIGETHKLYTRMINSRKGWKGFLWQGRFKSTIMDEKYLYSALRYVETNPVRAGITKSPGDYSWSSAAAHLYGKPNKILTHFYLEEEIEDWREYLGQKEGNQNLDLIRQNTYTGRPLGSIDFLMQLEEMSGQILIPRKPGPQKRQN
jgi:putative transposase